ncbi:flagellar biosynthesis protein FlhF [Hydrogenophaga sp.]|uniref:flagellar biosynthesis protein FlhF n=1 Tax=Hydrogenophaga sp. TaxID=1904254 RepID=UPI002BEBE9E0|nr:flagellar biosynthesis protein FlhF [Hydrogenophaga sp.]HMP10478.1 flagellar biosynthesis protein FlhF [Hydrogenophaga sp.]
MNIQRFTAPTSREAMAKARRAFGDGAVILSTRTTEEGFEVMAAAEETLAALPAAANEPRPTAPVAARVQDSVARDTEELAMSTLSFQEYVRERMLRKRKEAASGTAAPSVSAPVVTPAHAAPAREVRPVAPVAPTTTPGLGLSASVPPIRTRAPVESVWDEPAAHAPAMPSGRDNAMAVELSALRDMIEERFNTLAWLGSSKQNPVQSNLMLKLIRSGYSPSMARAVLEKLPAEVSPADAVRWVMDVITRNLRVAPPGASLGEEGGVIALIGATGVGKTTTAAKLAAQCARLHGASSVGLITLDSYRVAGYEQLRAYGRMLGVVAHLAHDRSALGDLLNLLSGKRMVIIDTAGLGQRDQRIQDMLDMLDMPKIKRNLVLNAGAHGDTIDDVLNSFKASSLHGVVLSKVDEAVKLGPAIDSLIRHQVVLRGVANGQRVPEDWQAPDAAAMVRISMGSQTRSAFDPVAHDMGFYFSQASVRGIDLGAGHV